MKNFHVFSGNEYFPDKFGDYKKSFETKKQASDFAKKQVTGASSTCNWYEIIESNENGLVLIQSSEEGDLD